MWLRCIWIVVFHKYTPTEEFDGRAIQYVCDMVVEEKPAVWLIQVALLEDCMFVNVSV